MPLYEFKCPECGLRAEVRVPLDQMQYGVGPFHWDCFSIANPTPMMERVFTPPAIRGETVAKGHR